MNKITALIPTYNNEDTILEVVASVSWCDEIFVVDSFSTDATISLLREKGIPVIQRQYINSADQKNWALQFIDTEWTLQIDTDEILETVAEQEIRFNIEHVNENIHCLRLKRKNHMWNDWIRYGRIYPDYENRVFRTKEGKWFDRKVHSNIRVKGEYLYLKSHILHFGMPNISKQVSNLDRYTDYEASEMFERGRSPSLLKVVAYPLLIFFDRYIIARGFLDGFKGFFLAVYIAFYYFLAQSKLIELHKSKETQGNK